ncbi:DUF4328 domain-containing protein [Streptomyces aureus]
MKSTARTAPRTLARCAQTAIGVAAVADVFRAAALRDHRLHPSNPSLESGEVSRVFVNLMTLAVVLFLVWLAKSRTNAQLLSPRSPVPTRGWTVGTWFVPVVNLFAPRRTVLDIGRASSPSWEERRDTLVVNLWWAAWITHGLILGASTAMASPSLALLVVAETLMIAAAVLLGLVIERITALQSAALTGPGVTAPLMNV